MKVKHATILSLLILNASQTDAFGQKTQHNQIHKEKLSKNAVIGKHSSLNSYPQIEFSNFVNLLAKNIDDSSKNAEKNLNTFQIISNKQLRNEEYFIAEGNVFIQNGSLMLIAERLEYNYKTKKISLEGKIKFNAKDQFLEASEFKFDLNNNTGYIKDVFGSITFDSLEVLKLEKNINDEIDEKVFLDTKIKKVKLNSTSTLGFEELDLQEEGSFVKKFTSQKFILDVKDPQEWRFKSNRININNNEWFAEKLILTNDPFNKPQLVIKNKGFKSINSNGEITLKSNWTTLVLDDKLSIPTGPRRYTIDEDYIFRWGIGYDRDAKDGFFISRNFDPKYFGSEKQTKLNIKKEFYFERALKGKTKSFSNKNESVIAPKSKRDAEFLDYFGLKGNLKTKFGSFDFNSDFSLNSLNPEILSKTFTNKSEITKILHAEEQPNSKKENRLSLFGNYREKVWNGSLGEREIISAYGFKISKSKNWTENNVSKSSNLSATYGDYKSSDRLDSLKIINRQRLNIFLERSHSYPLWKASKGDFIDSKNIYSPLLIPSGLNLNAQAKIDLYRYSDNNYQDLFIFRSGPELILGNFKKNLFDYSKINIYYKTTLSNGNSPFGFDQSSDNNTIEFNIKQQLFGPLTLDYKTEYNLDVNPTKNKRFFNTKYDLTWNRRAYSISLFYNNENKSGGLNFKINSFNFDGYGDNF